MAIVGRKNPKADLANIGLSELGQEYWNLSPEELIEHSLNKGLGVLSDTGALCINTGEFTGRSPKDRFVVEDDRTRDSVDWGEINKPISAESFDRLFAKIQQYLKGKDVYIRDAYACADPEYQLNIRVVTELPWANMFANNMFLRPTAEQIENAQPEWTVVQAPGLTADPAADGTRQHNFAVINFTKQMIIIGGTAYTGEIKKGIFSVLNYLLPHDRNVLSMHCSANIGESGDTALFFGLSGTGKTTLSADPNRGLIGDDEHGWTPNSVFNFEGGCYAKCIDLSADKEPEIFGAIKHGAILENIKFDEGTRHVNYEDTSITQNTRVSYPIYHIENAVEPSMGNVPNNIFFLTYDAFGVLPPISRLSKGQAMYHFISGYTSKVAGTEAGVNEPKTVFSSCFGAPFLPLHPTRYAELLGEKLEKHNTRVWLVNTGLTGGPYGTGKRMSLKHTRALITAALNGQLNDVSFDAHPVFGVEIPQSCPGVPGEVLHPKNTWADKTAYDEKANDLARAFVRNFKQFEDKANAEIMAAAPEVVSAVS